MCLGLDVYHIILVLGQNKDGLLSLGYNKTSIEIPTLITKLKEIKEISLSDYHVVALNTNGNAYSWGLGNMMSLGWKEVFIPQLPYLY